MDITLHVVERGHEAVKEYVDTYNQKEKLYGQLRKVSKHYYELEDEIEKVFARKKDTEYRKITTRDSATVLEYFKSPDEMIKNVATRLSRKMDHIADFKRRLDDLT